MKRISLLVFSAIFICGCSSVPFKHSDYIDFEGADPRVLMADFAAKLPLEFEMLNSAVFRYRNLRFSALGVTRVDTDKKVLSTAGFNHLGVLLFDLTLDNEKIEPRYVFPEFTRRGDFASAMLGDIKKIYFERVPCLPTELKKDKRGIVFKENLKDAVLEYVFSGEGRFLSEKNYYEKNKKVWGVSYYEYIFNNGKIYPKFIVLKHRKYGYELVINLKEIR